MHILQSKAIKFTHNKKEIGAIKQTTLETKVAEVRREFNV